MLKYICASFTDLNEKFLLPAMVSVWSLSMISQPISAHVASLTTAYAQLPHGHTFLGTMKLLLEVSHVAVTSHLKMICDSINLRCMVWYGILIFWNLRHLAEIYFLKIAFSDFINNCFTHDLLITNSQSAVCRL